jgi:tryptophan-rich sensory protein
MDIGSLINGFTEVAKTDASLISIIALSFFGSLSGLYANYLRGIDMKSGYQDLVRPSFAPPGWIFGVVWPILYILMGIGLGAIIGSEPTRIFDDKFDIRSFLIVWFVLQYALNFAWSLVYFGCNKIAKTRYLTIILAVFVILMTLVSLLAKYYIAVFCFLPYALWTTFASLLHWKISELNPGI